MWPKWVTWRGYCMGSRSWAGVLLPARLSLCFHSLCLPFSLTAQQSPHKADVLTTISAEQPNFSCSELISTKHGATFFLWGMAISTGEALPLQLAEPPGENSLAVWRAVSCVVGSSGTRDSAGFLRTATQIPLLDNFITVESFRAKDVLASLSSEASDSLFRLKIFLLLCVSHLYLAYLSGIKPLLSSY